MWSGGRKDRQEGVSLCSSVSILVATMTARVEMSVPETLSHRSVVHSVRETVSVTNWKGRENSRERSNTHMSGINCNLQPLHFHQFLR